MFLLAQHQFLYSGKRILSVEDEISLEHQKDLVYYKSKVCLTEYSTKENPIMRQLDSGYKALMKPLTFISVVFFFMSHCPVCVK